MASEQLGRLAHPRALVLVAVSIFAFSTSAFAQPAPTEPPEPTVPPTLCSYQKEDYLLTVNNPAPADRQEIMDLIHRFNWALDEASLVGVNGMLLEDVTYELCNGALQQLRMTTGRDQLMGYLGTINQERKRFGSKTRHIESNTLLNAVDANTVQGKTTLLVTLQFPEIEMPVLDYTASLHTTFRKDGNVWKFAKILLITDGAQVRLRAR